MAPEPRPQSLRWPANQQIVQSLAKQHDERLRLFCFSVVFLVVLVLVAAAVELKGFGGKDGAKTSPLFFTKPSRPRRQSPLPPLSPLPLATILLYPSSSRLVYCSGIAPCFYSHPRPLTRPPTCGERFGVMCIAFLLRTQNMPTAVLLF